MKITPHETQELDKRQALPYTITLDCPKCGVEWNSNNHDYFGSYLPVNKAFDKEFYCRECEHEWDVKMLITLRVEAV